MALIPALGILAAGLALATRSEGTGTRILGSCLLLAGLMLFLSPFLACWWSATPPLSASAAGVVPGWPGSLRMRLALVALTLAAAVLRLPGLTSDLWLDEIATVVSYLRLPPLETLRTYTSANQHLLNSLLGSISIDLFGESAWAARLPAAILGIAGIPAIYFLGRVVAPPREALFAAALLAVSYHHVWFSQSARGYTGMILFATLGTAFFLRAVVSDRTIDLALWVASMVAGILFMQNAAFVLAAQVVSYPLVALRGELRAGRFVQVIWWTSFAVLLAIAGHSFVIRQMIVFMRTEDRTGLGWTTLGGIVPVLTSGLIAGVGVVGLALLLILLLTGFVAYWKQSPLFAAIATVAPLANVTILTVTRYGAYPRFFLYVLPFVLLIAVRGAFVISDSIASRLESRNVRMPAYGILAVLMICSMASLIPNYLYPKQDYRGAHAFVQSAKAPGDAVAAAGLTATAYQAYYAPGMPGLQTLADLERFREKTSSRVWILYAFPRDMRLRFGPLYEAIERDFEIVKQFRGTVAGGDIYVVRSRERA